MASKKEPKRPEKRHFSAAGLQVLIAAVCVLLGALLTFVPEVDVELLCNIFCALLVAAGVAETAYYFITGGYRKLEDYNFAVGVLLLALGCCGFARIGDLVTAFHIYLAISALVLGVLALQNAVQLRLLDSKAWYVSLAATVLILFGAVSVLVDFRALWDALGYWIFLLAGVFGAVSLAVTAVVLRGKEKELPPEPAAPPPPPKDAPPPPPGENFPNADTVAKTISETAGKQKR